ncbi:ExeM/NucH family extracellular endonuclease [Dactylosporangium aurantiacum]|uniref:ExeM/NucH family extracellular endonuclease n=1 Tax=Dactylosporangium aurantiacum TaxID=35754 RepID=A0A9Q9ME43_9ACTN|nr:ExeM/NucH family extracellular endonuclease [Dactylosporangium aurantiacum]MDG6108846.1 ExeM/NucH family extracellular endonuclease [Dactylosporangium aurantiacum]UWZ55748.1 ExeM/NucH family extracellular endonuclease [Dactylosporangium aurantiacum]
MSRALIQRVSVALAVSTAGLAWPLFTDPAAANPAGTGLVISELYVNGGSSGASYFNKFVELYNPTSSPVPLSGSTLQYRAPTSTVVPSGGQVFTLTGTVAAHGHFLIQLPSNNAGTNPGGPLPTPDLSTGTSVNPGAGGGTLYIAASATGVLPTDASVIDRIGWGTSNAPEGAAATGNSLVLSYQRDPSGADTDSNAADFRTATPQPQNAASDGGTVTVTVTNPGAQTATTGTAIAPLTLTASGGAAPYTWTASGLPAGLAISADGVVSGTPAEAGTSTVTVTATEAGGASGSATFTFTVTTTTTVVPIAEIQGTDTDTSPYAGRSNITTEGVVTAVYRTGGFNGFYLQTGGAGGTEADDDTPGASDAIFVFGSAAANQVAAGDSVRVTGTVTEFQGTTEITGPAVTKLTTPLPPVAPGTIAWSSLTTSAQKEAHEGELIAPQGTFTVADNYDTNWYGSFTLAAGDTPLRQPTDAGRPGSAAALAAVADNAARMVTLDDGASVNYSGAANTGTPLPWLTATNAVSIGAKVTFHQPVILEYRFSLWNFQPTKQVTDDGAAVATFSDTRTGNQQPADVGGTVRLATFNVENYFPMTGELYVQQGRGTCTYYKDRAGTPIAVDECTGSGPRGAATAESFQRQQAKIVTGINRLGASVVSLEEVENSAKFGLDRDFALAGLVDALNAAAGGNVWAYVPSPAVVPAVAAEDVIRSAFIYKPAEVALVGTSTILTTQSGPGQPFSIAREPLAQAFKKAGATDADAFLVVTNHWKSRRSGAPLYPGDAEDTSSPAVNQGSFNETRVREAQATAAFAAQVAASVGTDRIFLVGDLNAYTHEDPLQVLYDAGYTDLGATYEPSQSTYSFDGLQGSLDHVLANPAARAMVTGADVWQINAQEAIAYSYSRYNYNATLLFNGGDPFAASDHDPVVVGLNPPVTPTFPAWSASKVYLNGDKVTYQGSVWQALWWTQNQTPGDPYGPWQQIVTAPDGTAVWTASRVFTAGNIVLYQGKKYVAKWWTRNQPPGDQWGPWQLVP